MQDTKRVKLKDLKEKVSFEKLDDCLYRIFVTYKGDEYTETITNELPFKRIALEGKVPDKQIEYHFTLRSAYNYLYDCVLNKLRR